MQMIDRSGIRFTII